MSGAAFRDALLEGIATDGATVEFPSMLHKTQPAIWLTKATDEELANYLFKSGAGSYSFWNVRNHTEILLVAHALASGRRDKYDRSIHLVAIGEQALLGLVAGAQVDEADAICIGLRGSHYNMNVEQEASHAVVARMRGSLLRLSKASLREINHRLEGVIASILEPDVLAGAPGCHNRMPG